MPWSNNSGGPWGGGGSSGGGGGGGNGKGPWGNGPQGGGGGGGRGPGGGGGQQPPDLDELFRQGQERFRRAVSRTGGGGPGDGQPLPGKVLAGIGIIFAVGAWLYASVFQVETNERAIVLTMGEYSPPPRLPGLNMAFWPIQTHETLQVTDERNVSIGVNAVRSNRRGGGAVRDEGLMLTGDENVVDVNFQIDWNIASPDDYLFNLAAPEQTIEAVSEASIREVIGRSEIQPVLNRDGVITTQVQELIQTTLDGYKAGINVIRVNFVSVAPPALVVEAFDDVTKAAQEQEALQLQAEGYSRQKLADARGESAQLLENADGYTARVVKDAEGEAARFKAIQEEYAKAPEVTRQRLYLETMERVLGGIDKIILDESVGGGSGGSGVVPYLPLNELGRNSSGNRARDQ